MKRNAMVWVILIGLLAALFPVYAFAADTQDTEQEAADPKYYEMVRKGSVLGGEQRDYDGHIRNGILTEYFLQQSPDRNIPLPLRRWSIKYNENDVRETTSRAFVLLILAYV